MAHPSCDPIGSVASPPERRGSETPASWPDRVERFAEALAAAGMSAKTIALYRGPVRRAERFFAAGGTCLVDASGDELLAFAATQGRGVATRRVMRTAFGHYFAIAGADPAALSVLAAPAALSVVPAPAELLQAAAAAGGAKGAALALVAGCGLHAKAAAALRWDELGGVELHPVAAGLLDEAGKSTSPYVFASPAASGHVDPQTLTGWIAEVCDAAGLVPLRVDRIRSAARRAAGAPPAAALSVVRSRRSSRPGRRADRPAPPWAQRVEDYRRYLRDHRYAPATVRNYTRAVTRAERHFAARGLSLPDATGDQLAELVALLPATRPTLAVLRFALTHYFAMLGRPGQPAAGIRLPRKTRMVCRALDEQQAAVLARAARSWDGPEGMAVLLGLYMALRREEIAKVRLDDIDDGWLTLVGKGNQPAVLPLHRVIVEQLAARAPAGPWLFPGHGGRGHVCPATVWNYVRKVAAAAGVDAVTVHRLRHTCLATANDATGDLRAVQELARHARPETTAGYTRATAARLVKAVGSVDYTER